MGKEDRKADVFKGSRTYLPDEKTPVDSPAARHLCELAMTYSVEKPLYVVAIGAITNVASALLRSRASPTASCWCGWAVTSTRGRTRGNSTFSRMSPARVSCSGADARWFSCPAWGCVLLLRNRSRTAHWLSGKNALCDYLVSHTVEEAESYAAGQVGAA